jgi:hypothetical protein
MNKNYIPQAFYLTLAIVIIFSLLSFINLDAFSVGVPLKEVNLYADILSDAKQQDQLQQQSEIKKIKLASIDKSCPPNTVCFQNFTSEKFPLDPFLSNLLEAKEGKSKVRIAWFGDSFSEADIVVGNLRDTLQCLFGGNGVGFLPITSEAPGFRRTVVHNFGGWKTNSIITNPRDGKLGINGYSYKPDSANYFTFSGTNNFKHTRSFSTFRLFYSSRRDIHSSIVFNRKDSRSIILPASDSPTMLTLKASNIRKVWASIADTSALRCYGASLEDETGVYIDNFSVKGNSGLGLLSISRRNFAKFDSLLNYNLIVLQFGLNVTNPNAKNFNDYIQGMTRLVKRLKVAFPETPILLLSVSDRCTRKLGEFVTMPVIPRLIMAQEKIAYDNKLLFWNLFEAMGGENSMAKFVSSKPSLANKDYTHLNFAGGRKIGLSMARSFVYEVDKYKERKK